MQLTNTIDHSRFAAVCFAGNEPVDAIAPFFSRFALQQASVLLQQSPFFMQNCGK